MRWPECRTRGLCSPRWDVEAAGDRWKNSNWRTPAHRGRSSVPEEFLQRVRAAADARLLFLPHTIRQMARPDRMITTTEVEAVVVHGELIEDYLEDVRGHSCLLLGFGENG